MNNTSLYLSSYVIALFIIYLLNNDLKKFKLRLYNEIDYKIWIKYYALFTIALIHLIWLFTVFFTDDINNTSLLGVPVYLLLPYFIYIITEIKIEYDCKLSNVTEKINKYTNYLVILYFIFILIVMLMSNDIKRNLIICMRTVIHKYL